ncbi:MAG: YlxR family protein [Clostridia bacterium]|nr:YlxR family protein [Clostridia bacterium]
MQSKPIPRRMCVGCRLMRPKKEMLRIVRLSNGDVVADSTGKVSGRGAYICPTEACFEKARRIRGMERALDTEISEEVFETLRKGIQTSDA